MRIKTFKQGVLLLTFLLLAVCTDALGSSIDNPTNIVIQGQVIYGTPRESSIEVTLDGHWLSVVFLENLGRVTIEVLDSDGNDTLTESTPTPNGLNIYIPYAGSYVIYFTLSNGDIYYGEFDITD